MIFSALERGHWCLVECFNPMYRGDPKRFIICLLDLIKATSLSYILFKAVIPNKCMPLRSMAREAANSAIRS